MLDLDFSTEQQQLKEMVRDVLQREAPLSLVRSLEDDPVGYSTELWATFASLDLLGLLIPETYGGSGMGLLEGVALFEELGRALTPLPLFGSIIAARAIELAGSETQRSDLLTALATGSNIIAPAFLEPDGGYRPRGITVAADRSDGGYVLSGTKRHVAFGSSADKLLVLARTGDGERDIDLFVVDAGADGITMTQQKTIASDAQYEVTFTNVNVREGDRVGAAGSGWDTWGQVLKDAQILAAAQAVGGANYALDITVQYAKDRQQFDKPLGAFQALAHYLADATTAIDGAEQLVHEAAWARATGRSVDRLAPMAKLFSCRVFRDTTATAQQIFGGIGFTVEFDIQLYFRRAKALQLNWGDPRLCEEQIAAAIFD